MNSRPFDPQSNALDQTALYPDLLVLNISRIAENASRNLPVIGLIFYFFSPMDIWIEPARLRADFRDTINGSPGAARWDLVISTP